MANKALLMYKIASNLPVLLEDAMRAQSAIGAYVHKRRRIGEDEEWKRLVRTADICHGRYERALKVLADNSGG